MTGVIQRGKVIRGDLAHWDGRSNEATRKDASGGTVTGLVVDNDVDVVQVFGSGTAFTASTLSRAVGHISGESATIVLAPGVWGIDTDVTIPSNISVRIPAGVDLQIANGVTLTINGPVTADQGGFYSGAGDIALPAQIIVGGSVWYWTTDAEESAGVTPDSPQYMPDDLLRYNLPVDGVSTCTAAINKAIAVANAFEIGMRFNIPRGTFVFATQPIDIEAPIHLRGQGKNATYLVRDYTAATANIGLFNLRAGASTAATGCTIAGMLIGTGTNRTGGSLISLVAPSSGDGPDYCLFDDLRLTNSQGLGGLGNGPDYPFYVDGSARLSPLGVRNTWVTNSIIFGGALGSAYMRSANGMHFVATDTSSSGSVSGKIVLTGISGNLSNDCSFIGGVIYGMDLDFANLVLVDSQEINGNITNTADVSNVVIRARQSSGTAQANWLTSAFQSPEGFPYQGQVFNGDVVVGATANIGAAPRHYVLGGSASCYYGEQTAANGYVYNSKAFANGGNYFHVNFIDGSTSHGSISSNGTNTAYNTSSDSRLKESIVAAGSAAAVIGAIQVRSFTWKATGANQPFGFIAQELVEVVPEAVTRGPTEQDMWGVDNSKLVPLLVKSVQELAARVAALEP